MTDDSCKPSRSAGSVPRACTPFSPPPPTSSVPVVAPPVFVPVSPVMPVMTVSGAAPDRFGNVDIRPFVRTVLDQALLDLDLFAPFLARIVESGTFAPASGISRDALGPAVRASLDLADSAVQDVSGKADKAVPSAAGNLASLGADGNLADSGKAPSDFAPASHASDGSIHHTASEIGQIAAVKVAEVVDGAPEALDTLKEIAEVIGTESGQEAGGILKRVADLEAGKANKGEMSIAPVAGSPDRKTIQLRGGMSATVLTEHQDVSDKVDKIPGKGLSENDYTDEDKAKLAGLSPQVQADYGQTNTTAPDFIKNKPTLAAVATSGSYNDLLGKPTKTSQLTNDSGFLTQHQDISGKLDGAAVYPVWEANPSPAYVAGTVVSYSGRLYRLDNLGLYGPDSPPDIDVEVWTEVLLKDLKQDALSSAQLTNIAAVPNKANTRDVAEALALKANAADLPYAIVTPGEWNGNSIYGKPEWYPPYGWVLEPTGSFYQPVTDGLNPDAMRLEFDIGESELSVFTRASLPGNLLDRAVNAVAATGATTLTLPPAVAGRSRDFYLKMAVTGSQSVTFSPSAGIAYTGFGNPAKTYPAGTYLLRFTETAANEFCVTDMLTQKQNALTEQQLANIAAVPNKANATDLPYALVTPGEWEFSGVPEGVTDVSLSWNGTTWSYTYVIGTNTYNGILPIIVPPYDGNELSLTFSIFSSPVTATRASLPGHLLDRAGNRVVVSGDTTLTLPEANPGYLRDFLVRLEISGSTVPTITFAAPTGETITYETDGDEFPVPDEAGNWLYSFTESCAAHKFVMSLKKVNIVAQGGS